jgi:transposase
MLDQSERTAILALHERGLSRRAIAKAMGISRDAVDRVIASGSAEVPPLERSEKAEAYHQKIVELVSLCEGNLVRVHEEIAQEGCELSYPALTAYCRRHGLSSEPKPRAGSYRFDAAEEMQHDTSPHRLRIGGSEKIAQCASLVFCYSRMKFVQYYPSFDRFHAKVFLTEALEYFGGSCKRCMVDNTSVIRLKGTGRDMVPAAEMAAFAERFGFEFAAHEVGDVNRSAHVERRFHHVENNFLAGRTFGDYGDLNVQATAWCDRDNARYRRRLRASPRDLFGHEHRFINALPQWYPEVYELYHRIVDVEGYVTVDTNRYSVPADIPVGRQVEARKKKDRVDIYLGPRLVASHPRLLERLARRVSDPAHRPHRRKREEKGLREKKIVLEQAPELAAYLAGLEKRGPGSTIARLRRLVSMLREYPREPLVAAIRQAEHYGLFDLERVERMLLARIAGSYFRFQDDTQGDPDAE